MLKRITQRIERTEHISGMGDLFGAVGQVAQRQVRVFDDRAGLVKNFHKSKPPFSGHAVPDVHIVGGGLYGAAAAINGI